MTRWPAPEPGCRLHPDPAVAPSPVAGDGLFATALIPAGTAVSRLGGRPVTGSDWRRPEPRQRYGEHGVPGLSRRVRHGS